MNAAHRPINQRAARIASLTGAAILVMTGNGLADRAAAEGIVLDLLDTASELAAGLASDTEDIELAN